MSQNSEWYVGVKGHRKELRWIAVPEDDHAQRYHPSKGFNTVLAVNFKFDSDNPPPETALYKGPFYIDIDVEESTATAIKVAKAAVKVLIKNGVSENDINIWASGKKGFHITVPAEVFCDGKGYQDLPAIYKYMAMDLKLPAEAMDYSVYSAGRGRMWRVAGVKRLDNGKYKVPLTVAELQELTSDGYNALIQEPRTLETSNKKPTFSPALHALFLRAQARVKAAPAQTKRFVDPEIRGKLGEDLVPPCGQLMLRGEVDKEKGYNALSIQFAKVVATFAPHESNDLISEFAQNNTGTNYNTEAKRKKHTMIAFRRATNTSSGYGWSCRSAQSVLKESPCFDCPVAHLQLTEEEEAEALAEFEEAERSVSDSSDDTPADTPDDVSDDTSDSKPEGKPKPAPTPPSIEPKNEIDYYNEHGLIPTDDGYAFTGADGVLRRVSNFTLELLKYYVEYVPAVDADRRTAIMARVLIGGKPVGNVVIEETAWSSKNAFIQSFLGLANASFYGKDDDVQKMRSVLVDNLESTTTKIRRVPTSGLHLEEVAGQVIRTWVEPGYSINNLGMVDTHTLMGMEKPFQPKLRFTSIPDDTRELQHGLLNLMRINEPLPVAQMFAWYMACHIKQHLIYNNKEFPLLSVSGNAGSGKTKGNELMASIIHGSEYHKGASPTMLPSVTPFVLWSTAASSKTTPVLWDEYNQSKLKKKYDDIGEVLKSAYAEQSVERGTLSTPGRRSGHGADIIDFPLTAPICVMSEQPITMPALVHRSVQVAVNPRGLNAETRAAFSAVVRARPALEPLPLILVEAAMGLEPSTVWEWMQSQLSLVPIEIGDRPRVCYAALLTGLRFFGMVCQQNGWDELEIEANEMGATLLDYVTPEVEEKEDQEDVDFEPRKPVAKLALHTVRSEVDLVLDVMAMLAASAIDDKAQYKLEADLHYLRKGNDLYLMPILAFNAYTRYVYTVERKDPPISNLPAFKALLMNEPYCRSLEARIANFAAGRPVFHLDIPAMEARGIETDMFIDGH